MTRMTINIIGAGKLGTHVTFVLKHQKNVFIQAVCNQTLESAQRAVQKIGVGQAVADIEHLPPADLTLITVPDDQVVIIADRLALSKQLKVNSVIMHCSGVLSADVLNAAKVKGCYLASMHPMKSFASTELCCDDLAGVYCALEGDERAVQHIKQLFQQIVIHWLDIDGQQKAAYHAAGVFASNYLISIAHSACQCFQQAGLSQDLALQVVGSLMQGTLNNIQKQADLKQSLTGPVQRGDLITLKAHMKHLDATDQQMLYAELGRNILQLTEHNEDFQSQIDAILQGY